MPALCAYHPRFRLTARAGAAPGPRVKSSWPSNRAREPRPRYGPISHDQPGRGQAGIIGRRVCICNMAMAMAMDELVLTMCPNPIVPGLRVGRVHLETKMNKWDEEQHTVGELQLTWASRCYTTGTCSGDSCLPGGTSGTDRGGISETMLPTMLQPLPLHMILSSTASWLLSCAPPEAHRTTS